MDFRQDPKYPTILTALSESRGLPPGLLHSVISNESAGNPAAVSPAGAMGLGQFMPATAQQYNVNLQDPADQMRGAADYLQDLIHKFDGNVQAAVSFYNGGGHNAQRYVTGQEPSATHVSPQNAATNRAYVEKVLGGMGGEVASAGPSVEQVNALVAGLAQKGRSTDQIIGELLNNPVTADLVSQGRQAGDSAQAIVRKLGGAAYAPIAALKDKVGSQSFLTNVGQGAGNAVGDMVRGAQQLHARVAGTDEQLKQLQAEEVNRQLDPERRALNDTVGGMVGNVGVKSLPYLAAGAATGGATVPMLAGQAAAGALDGALIPTTDSGQALPNVLGGAALGAAFPAGVKAIGAAPGAAAALAGKLHPAAEVAKRTDLARRLAAEGLPVNAMSLTNAGRTVAAGIGDSSPIAAAKEAANKTMATRIVDGLGINPGTLPAGTRQGVMAGINEGLINSEIVNAARAQVSGDYATALAFDFKVTPNTITALNTALKDTANPLTEGIRADNLVMRAADNLKQLHLDDVAVPASKVNELVSELKAITQSPTASGGEKMLAGKIVSVVQDALKDGMTPAQKAAFESANQRWVNLKAVEKMVASSGDTGTVTARQMLSAIKTGRFKNQFVKGDAPYQDLVKLGNEAYDLGNPHHVAAAVGRSLNTGLNTGLGVEAFSSPVTAATGALTKAAVRRTLGRIVASENPSVVRATTGVNVRKLHPLVGPTRPPKMSKAALAAMLLNNASDYKNGPTGQKMQGKAGNDALLAALKK